MNVIFVCSYLYERDLIAFRYFKANLLQTLINCLCENYSTIFSWILIMIQYYRNSMDSYVYIHLHNKVNSLFEEELRGKNSREIRK